MSMWDQSNVAGPSETIQESSAKDRRGDSNEPLTNTVVLVDKPLDQDGFTVFPITKAMYDEIPAFEYQHQFAQPYMDECLDAIGGTSAYLRCVEGFEIVKYQEYARREGDCLIIALREAGSLEICDRNTPSNPESYYYATYMPKLGHVYLTQGNEYSSYTYVSEKGNEIAVSSELLHPIPETSYYIENRIDNGESRYGWNGVRIRQLHEGVLSTVFEFNPFDYGETYAFERIKFVEPGKFLFKKSPAPEYLDPGPIDWLYGEVSYKVKAE